MIGTDGIVVLAQIMRLISELAWVLAWVCEVGVAGEEAGMGDCVPAYN